MTSLPPDTASLQILIARRNARRSWSVLVRLRGPAGSRERREAPGSLDAALHAARGADRLRLLFGSGFRAWLASVDQALGFLDREVSEMDLLDRAARGPWLQVLLPEGRLVRGVRGQARGLRRRLLEASGGKAVRTLQPREDPGWSPRPLIPGSGIAVARRVRSSRGRHSEDGRARARPRRAPRKRTPSRPGGLARDAGGDPRPHGARRPAGGAEHRELLADREARRLLHQHLGKSLVDLADDLLHETAHHGLHGLEEIEGPLDRDDGETH